jgi:hypothetical protein
MILVHAGAARTAARTLLREARDRGCGGTTAAFVTDAVLVRAGVKRSQLNDLRGPYAVGEPTDG